MYQTSTQCIKLKNEMKLYDIYNKLNKNQNADTILIMT